MPTPTERSCRSQPICVKRASLFRKSISSHKNVRATLISTDKTDATRVLPKQTTHLVPRPPTVLSVVVITCEVCLVLSLGVLRKGLRY